MKNLENEKLIKEGLIHLQFLKHLCKDSPDKLQIQKYSRAFIEKVSKLREDTPNLNTNEVYTLEQTNKELQLQVANLIEQISVLQNQIKTLNENKLKSLIEVTGTIKTEGDKFAVFLTNQSQQIFTSPESVAPDSRISSFLSSDFSNHEEQKDTTKIVESKINETITKEEIKKNDIEHSQSESEISMKVKKVHSETLGHNSNDEQAQDMDKWDKQKFKKLLKMKEKTIQELLEEIRVKSEDYIKLETLCEKLKKQQDYTDREIKKIEAELEQTKKEKEEAERLHKGCLFF